MSYLTSIAAAGITESIVAGIFGVYTLDLLICYLNVVQIELHHKGSSYDNNKCPSQRISVEATDTYPPGLENYSAYKHTPNTPPTPKNFTVSKFKNGESDINGIPTPILGVTEVVVYFSKISLLNNTPLLIYYGTTTPTGTNGANHHWYRNTSGGSWEEVSSSLGSQKPGPDATEKLLQVLQDIIRDWIINITSGTIGCIVIILLCLILYAFFQLPAPSSSTNTREWIIINSFPSP